MCFCFFNDTATTEIYTLSLHDALPISVLEEAFPWPEAVGGGQGLLEIRGKCPQLGSAGAEPGGSSSSRSDGIGWPWAPEEEGPARGGRVRRTPEEGLLQRDRKSTRLNSSHANILYAVFCLKKKDNSILFEIEHLLSL